MKQEKNSNLILTPPGGCISNLENRLNKTSHLLFFFFFFLSFFFFYKYPFTIINSIHMDIYFTFWILTCALFFLNMLTRLSFDVEFFFTVYTSFNLSRQIRFLKRITPTLSFSFMYFFYFLFLMISQSRIIIFLSPSCFPPKLILYSPVQRWSSSRCECVGGVMGNGFKGKIGERAQIPVGFARFT